MRRGHTLAIKRLELQHARIHVLSRQRGPGVCDSVDHSTLTNLTLPQRHEVHHLLSARVHQTYSPSIRRWWLVGYGWPAAPQKTKKVERGWLNLVSCRPEITTKWADPILLTINEPLTSSLHEPRPLLHHYSTCTVAMPWPCYGDRWKKQQATTNGCESPDQGWPAMTPESHLGVRRFPPLFRTSWDQWDHGTTFWIKNIYNR